MTTDDDAFADRPMTRSTTPLARQLESRIESVLRGQFEVDDDVAAAAAAEIVEIGAAEYPELRGVSVDRIEADSYPALRGVDAQPEVQRIRAAWWVSGGLVILLALIWIGAFVLIGLGDIDASEAEGLMTIATPSLVSVIAASGFFNHQRGSG